MADRLITLMSDNQIPSYVPIYNRLYADIISGAYPTGAQLPGEAALAEKYGVSRNTLRQALTILCEDGMIRKKQGKGTFISYDPNRKVIPGRHMNPALDGALKTIDEVKLTYNYGPPTEIAQRKLNIRISDLVMASDNLYLSERATMCYSFVQIPVKHISAFNIDLNEQGQADRLINRLIFESAATAHVSIRVIEADENIATRLQLPAGSSILYMEELLFNHEGEGLARYKFYLSPSNYHVELLL